MTLAQSTVTLILAVPLALVALVLAAPVVLNPWIRLETADRIARSLRERPGRTISGTVLALVALGVGGWWMLVPSNFSAGGEVLAGESWFTFGGGPTRCGLGPAGSPAISADNALSWQFRDPQILERHPFASSPAVASSRLVIGCDNYRVYCLDADNGEQKWTFDARYPVFSSPVIADGRVYVGEGLHEHESCRLYCLDLRTGVRLWERTTSSHTESTPTAVDGKVYFGAGEDGIYCCDAASGEVIWQFSEPHVDGCPLVVDGKVFFGSGYGFMGVYCMDARKGEVLWKIATPAPVWGAPSFADGRLYVGIGSGTFVESAENPVGEVRCLDPKDGSTVWRCEAPADGVLTSVAIAEGLAVFGSRDGNLYAVDAGSGELRWKRPVDAPILSSPAVADGRVFFGADDGIFRCVRLADGELLWTLDTTGDLFLTLMDPRIQSSPAVYEGKVFFGSSNGNVYCVGAAREGAAPVVRTPHASRLLRWTDAVLDALLVTFSRWTSSPGIAVMLAAATLALVFLPAVRFQARQLAAMELSAAERAGAGYPVGVVLCALAQVGVFLTAMLAIRSTATIAGPFLWIADLAQTETARLGFLPWVGGKLGPLEMVFFFCAWFVLAAGLCAEDRRDPGRVAAAAVFSGALAWLTGDWSAGTLIFASVFFLLIASQNIIFGGERRAKREESKIKS